METSILTSIKKLLGLEETYTAFDPDIIIHINSAFSRLNQLGVGPLIGFRIEDKTALWDYFLQGRLDLETVKSYIYLKVRLIFDPPQTGFLVEAIKEQIKEHEWELNVQAEGGSQNG
jgi:hypothetical protein